ncbi:hypothetical protein AMS68_004393 [Peltaster fructicola]|uniref:Arginine N-methyltransferase 2 n=1 Tax=Peltaster fructicola TaxID=286661 RepID=A0A6H0XW17_9PEZI|nr:hypothetical protein AMS68_004393 [Peltaster fructicola]
MSDQQNAAAMAAEIDTDTKTDEILLAATNHDNDTLKKLLTEPGDANVQDSDTGFTPLHAAVAACEQDDDLADVSGADGAGDAVHKHALDEEAALATVRVLFENGAIWNDLDNNDETPGCIALRLGLKNVYEAIVEAGIRAELLLSRLDEYEPLGDEEEEDDSEDNKIEGFEPTPDRRPTQVTNGAAQEPIEGFEPSPNPSGPRTDSSVPNLTATAPDGETTQPIEAALKNPNVNSEDYLASELTYSGDRLLDSDKNAVMMDWETEIMYKSVDKLVPKAGLRTMNVGFGMGIVDGAFLEKNPGMHHIIEAHPLVMQRMREKGWYDKPNVTVHEGRWQDVFPKLVEQGVVLDAIYFDTYAEDYKDLKIFFQDFVIGLLDSAGLFGFYNGLGADRQICYDVYTRIVEMDLYEAGLDTEWLDIQVPNLEANDEWKGVRHKYWDNVNPYRLPTCKFIG